MWTTGSISQKNFLSLICLKTQLIKKKTLLLLSIKQPSWLLYRSSKVTPFSSSAQIRGLLLFSKVYLISFKKYILTSFQMHIKFHCKAILLMNEKLFLPWRSQRIFGMSQGMGDIWGKFRWKRKSAILTSCDVDYDGLSLWVLGTRLLLSYCSVFMNQKWGF